MVSLQLKFCSSPMTPLSVVPAKKYKKKINDLIHPTYK